jgi:hypothetical protein
MLADGSRLSVSAGGRRRTLRHTPPDALIVCRRADYPPAELVSGCRDYPAAHTYCSEIHVVAALTTRGQENESYLFSVLNIVGGYIHSTIRCQV